MGQVDHHPEFVHLGDDLFPEGTQTVPTLPFGSAVGDGVVPVMRERKITDAQAVEGAQQRKGLLDGRPVLHADEHGEQTVLRVLGSLLRREGQGRQVRIGIDRVIDGRNHLQRIPRSGIRRGLRRGVKSEEGSSDSPALQFGEIDVPIFIVDAEVPQPNQLRGGIDMAVKDLHYFVP